MTGHKLDDFFESWFRAYLAETDPTTKMFFRAAFFAGVELAFDMVKKIDPAAIAMFGAEIAEFTKRLDEVRTVAPDETKQ